MIRVAVAAVASLFTLHAVLFAGDQEGSMQNVNVSAFQYGYIFLSLQVFSRSEK